MLSGKKFPQNVRALRMVVEDLLRGEMMDVTGYDELIVALEGKAEESRTTKLWVENLIKPVLLMMIFVRAEREADWALHLWAVAEMLPYFFAASHHNYARYGLYYLRSMQRLPGEVVDEFLQGNHVMRHRPGLWNAIWSDMFIESTVMRYGHGPGGLIGITLKPNAVKRWALSMHICSQLVQGISEMSDGVRSPDVTTHKEELKSRIDADRLDRDNIRQKLTTCIDPIDPTDHPSGIINIVNGRNGPESVNADNAVAIGDSQMKNYEDSWPSGFHSTLGKKVVSMDATNKHIKVGNTRVFDTKLIYSRVMGLQVSRNINIKDVLQYELAPVPASIFDDNGDMRITNTKSTLKRKLQVDVTERAFEQPDVVVVDGCAVMWTIHWPVKGTVKEYVDNFCSHIYKLVLQNDVYLVFDRYFQHSIKNVTRRSRAGSLGTRHHKLGLNTPLPAQKVALSVTENKVQLIDIICEQLLENGKNYTDKHKLVVTGQNNVPVQIKGNDVLHLDSLQTTHEEADVIIVQQVVHLASSGTDHIRVVCDDTDVFVLLCHHYDLLNLSCKLTMAGTSQGRTVVDIPETVDKESEIVPHLLAAHAVSGCDTVSYLFGIGKGTVIKTLKAGRKLELMGHVDSEVKDIVAEATTFIAGCYGVTGETNMSDVRYHVWASKMGKRNVAAAPDLKSLPPTSEAFVEHVCRAHLQACIWRSAVLPDPPALDPTLLGWSLDEASTLLIPVPMRPSVSTAPQNVLEMIRCGCASAKPCASARCGCYAAKLSCSMFCNCHGERMCANECTKVCNVSVDDEDINEIVD
ncbi:MAG: hypothetical protein ABW185_27110 [Sedimenticola sp.]